MTVSNYDHIAEWYNESILTGSLIHDLVIPSIFDLMGNIQGQYICDLACGQGIVTRLLATRGASVVGIDISVKMLEIAQRYEDSEHSDITYLQDDVQRLSSVDDATFDGVLCSMALMDIPDLYATFRSIRRILHPGGWFVFAITHPCFETPASSWAIKDDGTVSREVQGYFAEGFWRSDNPHGVRGQVGAYHRTMSTYLNTLVEAGLTLERIIEPQVTEDSPVKFRRLYEVVPAALVMRCRRDNEI